MSFIRNHIVVDLLKLILGLIVIGVFIIVILA